MRAFLLALLFAFGAAPATAAAPHFPALTGRVVDAAHLLSLGAKSALEDQLAGYERESGNQIVIATVPSLGGYEIEDYGYQLGRNWGIGRKGKNTGAVLIVAPVERKVRIEVGYGLEGTLTDAQSNAIIQNVILPDFRAKRMEQGVVDGTRAILQALGAKDISLSASPAPSVSDEPVHPPFSLGWTLLLLGVFTYLFIRHPFLTMFLLSGPLRFGGGGFSGGGFGGGGFSGGGGSFGGGGASGSW